MSKTNSESREVRESRELTDDELAPAVGGRNLSAAQHFRLAQQDFKDGDFAGAMAHLAAGQNALGGGWL